jgi:uncharacterized protein (TIGR00369 family)
MALLNPDHIRTVLRSINQGPFFKLLSMTVSEIGTGFSVVEIVMETKHLNPFGGIHGGVYASIIDTAAFWSVYCDIDERVGLITVDLKTDLLSPVKEGKIIAKGNRIKTGRTICLAEATVFDRNQKMLAHGTSKMMITQGGQTIGETLSLTDTESFPTKFL